MDEKIKSENYQAFGGINQKASPYVMTAVEFLDLTNFDFQVIGSLSQRWGSTQYVTQNFSGPISALTEFARLDGSSYVLVATANALWSGATTGQSQGLSLTNVFTQNNLPMYMSRLSVTNLFSNSIVESFDNFYYQDNQAISIGGPSLPNLRTILALNAQRMGANDLSFSALQNFLFLSDGNIAMKFDGISTSPIGLPPVAKTGAGTSVSWSSSLVPISMPANSATTYGFIYYASYVNSRGFEGPIWPICKVQGNGLANGTTAAALNGGTYLQVGLQAATPLMYDIRSINLYSYVQVDLNVISNQVPLFSKPYVFLSNTPVNGSTFVYLNLGATFAGQTALLTNAGNFPGNAANYSPLGMTLQTPASGGYVSEIDINVFIPRINEVFQNRLFLAGFSSSPSSVWFSDVGEPEGYQPDFNFEVRTNDSDYVSCLKSYLSALYIGKKNSLHVLSGDNPANFFLQQVSGEYGILNHKCAVVWEQNFGFLDRKGWMLFNGANIQCLSTKVQPIFDTMNYSAALTQACATHDKLRNQVMIGIPTNGATLNNVTLVYDYLLNAWTKYSGFNPSVFATIQGRNNLKSAFYGSYSGTINWFAASFLSDNGVGFTTYMKPRFNHDLGDSIQKQFRRLYVNIDPPSSTLVFGLNYFQDYGSSKVLQSTMVIGSFQQRNDFGISAKSMTFELANMQTNSPLRIHGYTIESRLQRRV